MQANDATPTQTKGTSIDGCHSAHRRTYTLRISKGVGVDLRVARAGSGLSVPERPTPAAHTHSKAMHGDEVPSTELPHHLVPRTLTSSITTSLPCNLKPNSRMYSPSNVYHPPAIRRQSCCGHHEPTTHGITRTHRHTNARTDRTPQSPAWTPSRESTGVMSAVSVPTYRRFT